jgi:uncharacterized protein (TIGR02284 family)
MSRPHSLDSETIARLRQLVVSTYSGRDDLYAAAKQVTDQDLKAICRKLADDLAGNTAYLEQIIAMQGAEPGVKEALASVLGEEIMELLRKARSDQGVVSAVQQGQGALREQYDATIAATSDAETQSVLQDQKEDVAFAERVLRHVAPPDRKDSPTGNPQSNDTR